MMDGIVRYNSSLAVVSVFGVAAGEYKVLCVDVIVTRILCPFLKQLEILVAADF